MALIHAELPQVAGIIVDSFYDAKTAIIWRRLYQLAELNRLQQNFPYPTTTTASGGGGEGDDHRMYVAEAASHGDGVGDEGQPGSGSRTSTAAPSPGPMVVGFCDVDCRPCKTSVVLPRPYLSDVAVHPEFRRRGIARALVKAAEDFVLQRETVDQQQQSARQMMPLTRRGSGSNDRCSSSSSISNDDTNSRNRDNVFDEYSSDVNDDAAPTTLWIRVHESNEAARAMYLAMNYTIVSKGIDATDTQNPKRTVLTLRKDLLVVPTGGGEQSPRAGCPPSTVPSTAPTADVTLTNPPDSTGTVSRPSTGDGDHSTNETKQQTSSAVEAEETDFFVI